MSPALTSPRFYRLCFAIEFALAAGLFGAGIAMGAWLYLAACPLCIIQRMIYLLIALIALGGLAVARSASGRTMASILLFAAAGTGAFVAGYQSYLQRYPTGIGCSANSPWWENLVYWAGEKLPLFFQAGGVCEDSSWKLLGLSIAEYSLIAFSGLALLALYALLRRS